MRIVNNRILIILMGNILCFYHCFNRSIKNTIIYILFFLKNIDEGSLTAIHYRVVITILLKLPFYFFWKLINLFHIFPYRDFLESLFIFKRTASLSILFLNAITLSYNFHVINLFIQIYLKRFWEIIIKKFRNKLFILNITYVFRHKILAC